MLQYRPILWHWLLHPRWHVDSAIVSGYSHTLTDKDAIIVAHLRLSCVLLGRDYNLKWRCSISFVLLALEIVQHFSRLFVNRPILRIWCSVFPFICYPTLYSDELIVHSTTVVQHLLAHVYAVADHFLTPTVVHAVVSAVFVTFVLGMVLLELACFFY